VAYTNISDFLVEMRSNY